MENEDTEPLLKKRYASDEIRMPHKEFFAERVA